MNPPIMAPAIPSSVVTMKPPGSLPGINTLAMMPMTRPNTIQEESPFRPPLPSGVSASARPGTGFHQVPLGSTGFRWVQFYGVLPGSTGSCWVPRVRNARGTAQNPVTSWNPGTRRNPGNPVEPREPMEPCLVLQQPALTVEAAAVSGQAPVRADDPVTRDDDRDRVGAVGGADGADGGRGRDRPRDLRVGGRRAGPDRSERGPHALLERRPFSSTSMASTASSRPAKYSPRCVAAPPGRDASRSFRLDTTAAASAARADRLLRNGGGRRDCRETPASVDRSASRAW